VKPDDRLGFCADEGALDPEDFIFETYFRTRHGAKLVDLEVLETSSTPLFPSPFHTGDRFTRFRARIAQPHVNFGPRIPNLLTAVCGEGAFFSPGVSAVKLLDLEFPASYLACFEGPRFGVKGFRDLLDLRDRPVFFGVVKPNVGLDPSAFADLAYEAWLGGLDAPKDDEMLADAPYSPLEERTKIMGERRRRAEAETGRRLLYVANITDEVMRLLDLYDLAVANGANSVMLNGLATGLSAVRMVARRARVPLVGHFDLIAPMARIPFFGVHTVVWTRLQRLAGFDAVIMPGFGGRMFTPEEEVLANVRACLDPLGDLKPCLPAPGGSDWAGTLRPVFEKLGTVDFGFVPGRGVFGHPDGPRAGAKSLLDAWDAIREERTLEDKARESGPLRRAIELFG
jgi:ribulose-bisphosphate carboxylase large chain